MDLKFRYLSAIDEQAITFETALRTLHGIEVHLQQCCLWLGVAGREFRLLQVSDENGSPLGQIAAQIHRPRRARWYVHAFANSVGVSFVDAATERACVDAFARFLKGEGVSRLRTRFYRLNSDALLRTAHVGGVVAPPLSYERTLIFDLTPTPEEMLSALDKKVRAKILHRTRDQVEIRRLEDTRCLPTLQAALDAAFSRTGRASEAFDFEPYFLAAKTSPDHVLILGLYLKSRPQELLAYSIDVRHGSLVEAVSSGSLPDPELRKLHFNYFLFWEKVLWARNGLSTHLDLGGVTAGGPDDPLAGISRFKRQFTQHEAVVNHERIFRLRPAIDHAFQGLNRLMAARLLRAGVARAAVLAAAFVLSSWPL